MEDLRRDFVNEEIVKFQVEGREFAYKPTTAGEENEWMNEYIKIVDDKMVPDLSQLNKCKFRNLVGVPYEPQIIQEVLHLTMLTPWENLDYQQKWEFIGKLHSALFDKIVKAIRDIDSPVKKKID